MDDARRVLALDVAHIIAYLPRIVGMIIIIAVGALVAWLAMRVVAALLVGLGFDRLAERTGLRRDLAAIGITAGPSLLVGGLIGLIIVIATLVQAIDTLELAPLSLALGLFLAFMPHVVLALAIILAGVIIGDLLGGATARTMSRSGLLFHDLAGPGLRTLVILLAVLMALQQLTIASGFLLAVVLMAFGGIALAGGLALGWGGRTFAENLMASRYVERHLHTGDHISVGGLDGTIERIDVMSTILRTADERSVIIPNGVLARSAVEARAVTLP